MGCPENFRDDYGQRVITETQIIDASTVYDEISSINSIMQDEINEKIRDLQTINTRYSISVLHNDIKIFELPTLHKIGITMSVVIAYKFTNG